MKVVCTTLWLPKKGNSDEEYEDAAAPLEPVSGEMATFRCAVADGATETSFAGLWAKLLVDGFVNGVELAKLQEQWHEKVGGKKLAWYAEEKMESGAFAAFVSLTLNAADGGGGTWESEALGDSCLIQLRGKQFLVQFPMKHSEEFNSSPVLLSSNPTKPDDTTQTLTKISGDWKKGDMFYLLSDAIAKWVYRRQEEYSDAASFLKGMKEKKDLIEFAKVERDLIDAESRPLMRNDDVTLMRVVVS